MKIIRGTAIETEISSAECGESQNNSNATATEVVFELDVDGALVDTFYDTGSFAPGVTIKHTFTTDTDASNAQIEVAQVTFADGHVWASGN